MAKLGTHLKRRGEVTALDIDKRMLRVVHVTSSRGSTQVRRVELLPVPSEDFDLQNPSKVGEWIGEQLKAIRLTPGTVVMAVRRGEALLLAALDWAVRPGEHWLIAGGNGAGKSTLSRLLAVADAHARWPNAEWPPAAATPALSE